MGNQVEHFKNFVKYHPKLIEEVRGHHRSWKEIYEEWVIFGSDHEMWVSYDLDSEEASDYFKKVNAFHASNDFAQYMMSFLKKVDIHKIPEYAAQVNQTLSDIQELVVQFQKMNGQNDKDPWHGWS